MRFSTLTTLLLVSSTSLSLARYSDNGLAARDLDDVVLDAREVLEDLGFHARAFQSAALSARRLDHLEARMAGLEEELEARDKNLYKCPKCSKAFATLAQLKDHETKVHPKPKPSPRELKNRTNSIQRDTKKRDTSSRGDEISRRELNLKPRKKVSKGRQDTRTKKRKTNEESRTNLIGACEHHVRLGLLGIDDDSGCFLTSMVLSHLLHSTLDIYIHPLENALCASMDAAAAFGSCEVAKSTGALTRRFPFGRSLVQRPMFPLDGSGEGSISPSAHRRLYPPSSDETPTPWLLEPFVIHPLAGECEG
ncbi:hypothetical protein FA13DRAFT_1719886 [Coprinellus micaceus]|uniref:C2H2-type domain-containing protein n=1 Tax=Coprinellus micaceus TaxID=71717 RepID=A0A4Y7SC64_COPMI|nr:hypothetical protein FA13DRAFT_1719886 [Coprinellus micaceus]